MSSDTGRRGSRMGGAVNVIANTNGCELSSGRQLGSHQKFVKRGKWFIPFMFYKLSLWWLCVNSLKKNFFFIPVLGSQKN